MSSSVQLRHASGKSRILMLVFVGSSLVSCATLWGFDDVGGVSAGANKVPGTSDAGGSVDANSPTGLFNALDDESKWASFDVASVNPRARGFHGVVRDKRYVYFVPYLNGASAHGVIARYDTAAVFGDRAAWTTFDIATLDPAARGFIGGAFDGRYLYLAPYSNGVVHGNVARYDTEGSFTAHEAWTTFNVSTVFPAAKGFFGAVFDGHFVYFVPQRNGAGYDGVIARYDTRGGFGDASAWSMFDIATLDSSAVGFFSGTFDGRFLYLSPNKDGALVGSGVMAQYDTQAAFDAPRAWTLHYLASTTADGHGRAYYGATYDGRAVYFGGSLTARFDPGRGFDADDAWSVVEVATVTVDGRPRKFAGTAFDTNFLYLAPYVSLAQEKPVVARHRVAADELARPEDWSSFDISRVVPVGANAFWGAAFDGNHVYFAPVSDGVVARFEAVSERLDVPVPPSFL